MPLPLSKVFSGPAIMASDYGRPSNDRLRGDFSGSDSGCPTERNGVNGGPRTRTPDSTHRLKPAFSGSSMPGAFPGGWADDSAPRKSGDRNRSRQRNGRTASGQMRICKKCGEPLTGQFVRALDGTFHLDCFKCRVCHLFRVTLLVSRPRFPHPFSFLHIAIVYLMIVLTG